MKKIQKLLISSHRLMKTEDLLSLKGGVEDEKGCGGRYCHSASECCPLNPVCGWAPGFPDHKICMSP
jgi:hypothetical protein